MVINAMAEDNDYETPDQADLESWADTYGLSIPVVADVGYGAGYNYGLSGGLPHIALVEPGMIINNISYPSEEQIAELLGE